MDVTKLSSASPSAIANVLNKKGYRYYSSKTYNLNLIGVRMKKESNVEYNTFDDILIVEFFNENQDFIRKVYPITTVPGVKSLKNPMNSAGCAILVEGQYKGLWKVGLHKGEYKALIQNNPCTVYRDNDKNAYLAINNTAKRETGIFGINLHRAGINSTFVDSWSAGCQVFKNLEDFNEFMKLVEKACTIFENATFTYTLLNQKDLL